MELNNEQKKAAFCTDNAVVAAGAGSGKTLVLANRFVWLLTEKGYRVDEILTLTFTKKAAAQMYRRIYSLVSEIAVKESGIKAERARIALDDFIHARIQTLDSYSASLVKQCAPRYGISPDFLIDQERCRQLALEVSYPFMISRRHHPAIEKLYSGNRPNDIVHNIFAEILFNYCLIDKPVCFISGIKNQFFTLCEEWKKHSDELKEILNETNKLVLENDSLLPEIVPLMEKYRNGLIIIPEKASLQEYLNKLLDASGELCIDKAQAHPLNDSFIKLLFFLNDIKGLNLQRGKRTCNPVKDNIKKIRTLFIPISSLAVSCIQAGFTISIMPLLEELQEIYLRKKRAEGILTFHDTASLSRTILLEQEDIRQSEKESFKAIMIDEFQDNNELQKDLLFLLAEKPEKSNKVIPPAHDLSPGKLFFVGDEKQSIYLFRGADVSVFRKLKEEIKSLDLPLKINYRSSPALIGAFNAIFGGSSFDPYGKEALCVHSSVFAPSKSSLNRTENLPLYEASYAPLEAGNNGSGNFSICILNKKSGSGNDDDDIQLSSDENEARFTAEKIRILLDERKYTANEIAILLRTRSSQHLFEKHLRLLDIPYACEDINNLFSGGPVNDIMSVLRLAVHPHDSAAYAQMLRSPFAGLSIGGTAVCLSFYLDETLGSLNYEPFDEKPIEHLDKEDREKYYNGKKIYQLIRQKSGKETICSLVSELWYGEGYRYETEWNKQTAVFREFYDYLFHLAAKADEENQGLASFTDSMSALKASGGQLTEIDIPLERPNAIHLMTIHKSKGLEFPVVFLCGCGKRSHADRCETVYFSDEHGVVLSSPVPDVLRSVSGKRNNFLWQLAGEEAKRKRTAELRRLLYVGMTRAEKELYITGSLDLKDTDEACKDESENSGNILHLIKIYTQEKHEDSENFIEGDSIIDNDTFFGLLLPSIVSHIPPRFFNIEEIPVYTEEYLKKRTTKTKGVSNDQKGLNEFIKNAESCYEKAKVIKTQIIFDNHISPVSLKTEGSIIEEEKHSADRKYSGEKPHDEVFKKADSLLKKFSQNGENSEKFNSLDFGTIAHICTEAHLNGSEPEIPAKISGSLNHKEMDILLEAGKELAICFVNSPLGKTAKSSSLMENEFPFRSFIKNSAGEEIFINGTIDLFFEDNNTIHVVDFKTDTREIPSEHTAQMTCYYKAICDLFAPEGKECRIWLYYLRTGHAVEMTERSKNFNLEKTAFNQYNGLN